MDETRLKKAEELANQPYEIELLQDKTTDSEPIILALNPELDGCMAQGETPQEAIENLHDARIDYIYSLLEDGLDVPAPAETKTRTSPGISDTFVFKETFNKEDISNRLVKASIRI